MLKIAICDDETEVGAFLERTLIDILNKLKMNANIQIFLTGESLYNKIESSEYYDLIFLDIEFSKNEINGVEVGRLIRDTCNNNTTQIVYISWEKSYSMQLFEVRPMDFLIKPLNFTQIDKTIKTYLRITRSNFDTLTYKKGRDTFDIQIKDIMYLENSKRKIIIYLSNGTQEDFYGSLNDVYSQQLKSLDFLFPHASFAVNYDYITAIKHNLLLIDNLISVPIAQSKRTDVKKKYLSIMKRRRRD